MVRRKEMKRIEDITRAVDEITSNDYCAREMDTVDSEIGDALEVVIHNAARYTEVYDAIQKKIQNLKKSSDYPHNFKGQMVEDFEWVLSLME